MKIKKITLVLVLISIVICFSFNSCQQVTDMSEHKAEFYVFNTTESLLTVEFISYEKKSVFKECSINDIKPVEENDPILGKKLQDIAKFQDKEKVGYVFSNFIPGTYFVDIDGFSQSEDIYPILYKGGKKINIKNEKGAYMDLRYNSNPSSFFIILKSKLKLNIDSATYNKVLNENIHNSEIKDALDLIYFKSISQPEQGAVLCSNSIISTPKRLIEKIRILEGISLLVDNDYSYFIFHIR